MGGGRAEAECSFRAGAPEQSGLAAHDVTHKTHDKGCDVRCMPPSRQSGQGDEDGEAVASWPQSCPKQEEGPGQNLLLRSVAGLRM